MSPRFGHPSTPPPPSVPTPPPAKVDPKKPALERRRTVLVDKIKSLRAQLLSEQNYLGPRRSVVDGLKVEIKDLEDELAEINTLLL